MDNNSENQEFKVSTSKLLAFQRDLKQEKDLLQKVLAKIDEQVHRLQVEQLHLLGLMNKCLKESTDKSTPSEPIQDNEEKKPSSKYLDLTVPSALQYFQEEIEEDDDV